MLKPSSNRSLVSNDDRVRYVDGTTCLTIWYDEQKEIIAFEVIFGLVVDEWAFLYHRKGTTRYCKVDDGNNRIQGSHSWIKKELFSNRNSLKRAFLLKEILDKPKSLRPF